MTGTWTYSVKIMNSKKRSEYTVRKWRDVDNRVFEKFDDIKAGLSAFINESELVVGFIEPGHGAKGCQRWLHDDGDLKDMYDLYKGKKEIMLWCYSVADRRRYRSRSRSSSPQVRGSSMSSTRPRSKVAQSLINKRDEVDAIVEKIREKHEHKFTPAQINTWAHCIHMKMHFSYDEPPDKPFFKNKSARSSAVPDLPSATGVSVSPGKRISLHSQCIEQIDKWHQLYEKGVISEEQYKEIVDKVWDDIKKF